MVRSWPLAEAQDTEIHTWWMTAFLSRADVQDMGFCLSHCVKIVYYYLSFTGVYWRLPALC